MYFTPFLEPRVAYVTLSTSCKFAFVRSAMCPYEKSKGFVDHSICKLTIVLSFVNVLPIGLWLEVSSQDCNFSESSIPTDMKRRWNL